MGIRDFFKKVLSTGQASMVEKADGLYASGDLEGAVKCLEEALQSRQESGKSLAVMRQRFNSYSEELHLKRLNEHRNTLAGAAFDTGNYSRIEGILSALDRGIKESVYRGKPKAEAEALYKEYLGPFQDLQRQVQKEKHGGIIDRIRTLSPEEEADEFVTLVEELRRMGGRLPEELHGACKIAEERSYVLPDDLREFANFVIERKLGNGGFASVFLASSKGIGYQSAIKIFAPQPTLVRESGMSLGELKDRFKREARIMLRLSEERTRGIVNVRHSDFYRGKPYLLMDYYPRNLSDLIGGDEELLQGCHGKFLSYEEGLPLIQGILTSIHGLHNRPSPIIHRDLKPPNILLDKDNRPHIADFGLARETSRIDLLSSAFQSSTGTNFASQYYGAPEQRGGFKEADQRADIFSLGVMIYRILTGRLIGFHDQEPLEYYVKDLNAEMAGRMNDLLGKATRVEPNQRLSDVSTLLELFSAEQTTVQVNEPVASHFSAADQFCAALEMAYAFAPDGELPESARTIVEVKAHELGMDEGDAKALEKDFRSRLGLGEGGQERVVSATAGASSSAVSEKGAGELSITSEPELATVFVDGVERGKTPVTLSRIGVGKRTIRLKLDGYFPVSRIERVAPDQETKIHVILEPQLGSIKAEVETFSDDYPCRFYLDESLMGKTPLMVEDVSAGVHAWRLEAEAHQGESGEVAVTLDEEAKVVKKLEPLPGRISIKSVPSGASVWLNGKNTGKKTDGEWKFKPGTCRLLLKLPGYVDAERELKLLSGGVLEEMFTLVRNAARLSVTSVPEGADIWLDDKDTGQKTDAVLEVSSGKHTIVLKRNGYQEAKKEVELTPDKFQEVEFRLKKGKTPAQGRYAAIGSNIVKDTKTGFEWLTGPDEDTTWKKAKSWVANLKTDGGGWRMPTMDELEGIYEKGLGDRNMTPLLETTGWWVWSGETSDSSAAGNFDFHDGNWFWSCGSTNSRVFAVRSRSEGITPAGLQPDKIHAEIRYSEIGNKVVKDMKTGLEWLAGADKDTNWNEAKAWVAKLKTDGAGWRMPSMDELEGIYEKGLGDRNMTPLLKTTGWCVWSGETKGYANGRDFNFYRGGSYLLNRYGEPHSKRGFAVRSRNDG